MTTEMWLKVFWSFVGTLGVALSLGLRPKRALLASIGSGIAGFIYTSGSLYTEQEFIRCFCGAAFASVFAEICARIAKAPATVFLAPAIVPLLPGGYLYYTMHGIITGSNQDILTYGNLAIHATVGTSMGILIVSTIIYHINRKHRFRLPGIHR